MPVGKAIAKLAIPTVIRFLIVFPAFCFILDAAFGADGLMWVQPIADTIALILAAVLFIRFISCQAYGKRAGGARGNAAFAQDRCDQPRIRQRRAHHRQRSCRAAQNSLLRQRTDRKDRGAERICQRNGRHITRSTRVRSGAKRTTTTCAWTAAFSEWINVCRRSKSCIDIFAKKR